MIPFIQKETVEKHNWIDEKDILEIIAISESTPGPIAINTATFIGTKVAGFWGSFFATLGVVLPSYIIILLISLFFAGIGDNKYVEYAFFGIRAGVIALVVNALFKLCKACERNTFSYIVIGLAFVCACVLEINVLVVIAVSALLGVGVSLLCKKEKKK